ncbi:MAG: CDP-glycerol glycerophosphotransferase family protein [Salibacteraceae bacterium]
MTNHSQVFVALRSISSAEWDKWNTSSQKGGTCYTQSASYVKGIADSSRFQARPLSEKEEKAHLDHYFQRIVELGHLQVGGQPLYQWYTVLGKSYWTYARPKLYFSLKDDFLEAQRIAAVQATHPNASLVVFASSNAFLKFLPEQENLSVVLPAVGTSSKPSPLPYLLIFLLRVLSGLLQWPLYFRRGKHLILTQEFRKQPIVDLATGKLKSGDEVLEYLLEKAASDPDFLFVSDTNTPDLGEQWSLQLRRYFFYRKFWKKTLHFEPFLVFAFLQPRLYRDLATMRKALRSTHEELLQHNISDPVNRALIQTVKRTHRIMLLARHREIATTLLTKLLRPKSMGGTYETAPFNRPKLDAAQALAVKTYGILHGGINQKNINYILSKQDPKWLRFPDFTIARGLQTKGTLVERSAYPAANIQVLGQLRTDCISVLKNRKKTDVLIDLEGSEKVVLFASQPTIGNNGPIRDAIVSNVLQLAAQHPDHVFIIKPHPLEKDDAYFHRFAAQFESNNYRILRSELYELLAVSDVVITHFSTVGAEAVFFDKPLLTIDPTDEDLAGYYRDGVALKARNYSELASNLSQVLHQGFSCAPERRASFIAERVFKIDGATTQRYYDFIRSLS